MKLPYLESLGIDILYLSPVFLSPSYHKYDTIDYYSIEEVYGGRDGIRDFVKEAHKYGMRVLMDGVFNHCSDKHPYFVDVLEKGASSLYKSWFTIFSFDDDGKPVYDSFGGLVPGMPRWNTCNPEVVDYLCDIAAYWTLELDIDGWRLDVADEVPHSFWRTFRKRLRALRHDILLIGEIWNHASAWLMGDEFDGLTNYKFRKTMLSLATRDIDAKTFWWRTNANLRLYKTTVWPYLVNLVGSHDTVRLFTTISDYENAALALLTTLCFEGMPLIYYGDEIGMEGGDDPDNRRAMIWDVYPSFLADVKTVGQLRSNTPALKTGATTPIASEGALLHFLRSSPGAAVGVAANFGKGAIEIKEIGSPLYCLRTRVGGGVARLEGGGLYIYATQNG